MPSPAYYRKQAELMARLALANINDPSVMERYNALAMEYLAKADEANITGPMPPPGSIPASGRGADPD